ncbi:Glutathione S-transferase theta-2 [Zootermopsis nevadensis]|uniref:Glutathione S-transferase theta-2 n=1 Tax=Zootermopsis nevadensis TaxID=136037 RepID=A0A067QZ95_ZOONE|nr:Glutathione S-transferase theta-2 [Zootermopsis nevadensis]
MTVLLKLYGSLLSQPSRAVELFLSINKIPYQSILINVLKEDHKSDKFLKLNPFNKIPVIDDDGFVLKERYVEETNGRFGKQQLTIMSQYSSANSVSP